MPGPNGTAGTSGTHSHREATDASGYGVEEGAGFLAGFQAYRNRKEAQSRRKKLSNFEVTGHQEILKIQAIKFESKTYKFTFNLDLGFNNFSFSLRKLKWVLATSDGLIVKN